MEMNTMNATEFVSLVTRIEELININSVSAEAQTIMDYLHEQVALNLYISDNSFYYSEEEAVPEDAFLTFLDGHLRVSVEDASSYDCFFDNSELDCDGEGKILDIVVHCLRENLGYEYI